MALAGAAVAVAAGWSGAQAETWQQRLDALEAGAPAKLDLGTHPQLAQETEDEANEPITAQPGDGRGRGRGARPGRSTAMSRPKARPAARPTRRSSRRRNPSPSSPPTRWTRRRPAALAEALRYTPGVTGELCGHGPARLRHQDPRLRGRREQLLPDGLQLKGTSFASFLALDPTARSGWRSCVVRLRCSMARAARAGVINYVSKRPTAEPQYELEVGAGTFDRFEGKFDFSGPITEDGALRYRDDRPCARERHAGRFRR